MDRTWVRDILVPYHSSEGPPSRLVAGTLGRYKNVHRAFGHGRRSDYWYVRMVRERDTPNELAEFGAGCHRSTHGTSSVAAYAVGVKR